MKTIDTYYYFVKWGKSVGVSVIRVNPGGLALDLKVLVPDSNGCAPQFEFEFGYLHFEKNPCASNLPH